MQIHVNRNGQQFGPYTFEELANFLQQGSISRDDWAWHEGLANWVQISQLEMAGDELQAVSPVAEENPQRLQDVADPVESSEVEAGSAGVSAESAMERLRRLQRNRMPAGDKAARRKGVRSNQTGAVTPEKIQPAEAFDVLEPKNYKRKLIGVIGSVALVGLIGYAAMSFLEPSGNVLPKVNVPEAVNIEAISRLQKFGAHVTRDQNDQINGIQFPGISISTNGWKLLAQLHNVQKLEMVECGIDDAGALNLRNLIHLKRLNLSRNPLITDKSVGVLKELTQLKVLNITDTKVTKKGVAILEASLSNCAIER